MIFIILSWIYIAFIFFSFGVGYTVLADKLIPGARRNGQDAYVPHASIVFVSGIVFTSCIAVLLSLFMPLSWLANVMVIVLALLILITCRKRTADLLSVYRTEIAASHWTYKLLFIGFLLIMAYLSLLPSSHNDDGLYYSNTIKWVEEYGVVKGIANVNVRLGFNSNWHVLQALFSFHYLRLGNFNDLNGLLLVLVFPFSLAGIRMLFKGDHRVSTIVRALFFLPLFAFHFGATSDVIFFNVNFLSAPAADLAVCVIAWLVLACLCGLDHLNGARYQQQALFIVLTSAFLFTVKPSAAPLLMICAGFFFVFLYRKQFTQVAGIAIIGLLIMAPWIARNIIISGYPVFPVPATDFLQVDWKVPIQHVEWMERAVKIYAINPEYDLNGPFTIPMQEWFPVWFSRLNYIQSVIFMFSALSAFIFIIVFITGMLRKGKNFLYTNRHLVFAVAIAITGLLFWFIKGPDPRLGYGFTAMLSMLMLSVWLHYFLGPNVNYAAYVIMLAFYCIGYFYYRSTWKDVPKHLFKPLPERRLPKSFTNVTLPGGMKLHLAADADLWYMPLPVAIKEEYAAVKPVPRGATIKDGFKPSQNSKPQ